jgi:hypothetical protein
MRSSFEFPVPDGGTSEPGFEVERNGVDLLIGKRWAEVDGLNELGEAFFIDVNTLHQRIPPEPFALFAALAAAVALVSLIRTDERRAVTATGLALLMWLMIAISPSLSYMGLAAIELEVGFFLGGVFLVGACGLGVWSDRRVAVP